MPKKSKKQTILLAHPEALPAHSHALLQDLKKIAPHGVLGGGTALALQIGHRVSFDLDLFLPQPIPKTLLTRVRAVWPDAQPIIDTADELTVTAQNTKVTFLYYPFAALHDPIFVKHVPMFDIRDIASSKAYAIGRRGVWRDYADMFLLVQQGLTLQNIMRESTKRFGDAFNGKLFLQQLTYWDDIPDKTIEWIGKKYTNKQIEQTLVAHVQKLLV